MHPLERRQQRIARHDTTGASPLRLNASSSLVTLSGKMPISAATWALVIPLAAISATRNRRFVARATRSALDLPTENFSQASSDFRLAFAILPALSSLAKQPHDFVLPRMRWV
jgi:hypothetical protein